VAANAIASTAKPRIPRRNPPNILFMLLLSSSGRLVAAHCVDAFR
jgi:hypothetical protein